MRCSRLLPPVLGLLLSHSSLWAQGTLDDYQRAERISRLGRGTVIRDRVSPHWMANGSGFWYVNRLPKGQREYVAVDFKKGKREPAFDHQKLAEALSRATKSSHSANNLRIEKLQVAVNGRTMLFLSGEQWWNCDRKSYALTRAEKPKEEIEKPSARLGERRGRRPRRPNDSPDGKWTVIRKNFNLFLRDRRTGKEKPLTTNGKEDHGYSYQVFWAPDSKKVVGLRTKAGTDRIVHLIESSPRDQLQPKLHRLSYRKPGDEIPLAKPHLFDIESNKEIPVSDELFPMPWELRRVRWRGDSSSFAFLYNQRGHQLLRVISVDAGTGKVRALVEERSKTFIDYAHKTFLRYLDATGELIWMSERDGWCHLYLYDQRSGKVKNQITKGEWVVRSVEWVDPEKREIWFRASGIYPDQDPYYIHFCRIGFDGTGLAVLTAGNGSHTIELSPDKQYLIDRWSRVNMPPVHVLRRSSDGKEVCKLEKGDASVLLETGWKMPEPFVAKARDGKTDIYGVIYRPTTFDPKKKYPVIEKIYAGPQGSFVPKSWRTYHSTQAMAELGFIVVQIDGMGTSNRSKAFHDVCWKNLGDSGFPDRILWIKAAAKQYPWMDLSRMGIYGGSAGGQSTLRGLLAHGDFYKVGVADCGCHDNRMDKIWWNELWMGWPLGPHYKEQSNVTQAHKLQGKLFLIVGELDKNVDPASTMQVVNALIKADKDFDLLVVPGGGHGIGGRYGIRRRRDFFVRHLLGVEPRADRGVRGGR